MKKIMVLSLTILVLLSFTGCGDSTSSKTELNQPTDFAVIQQASNEFSLTWTDNSKKEDGYKIERKFDDGDYEVIATLDEDTDTYLDDISISRDYWQTVYYKVYSYEDDTISLAAEDSATIDFPAPTSLSGEYGDGEVLLQWTDNSTDEAGFMIQRIITGGEYETIGTVEADTAFYIDSSIQTGNTYYYKVYAYIGSLYSAPTNEILINTMVNPMIADFEANITTGYNPLTVTFTDLSTGNDITSWAWDFGNGTTSSEQNPQAIYTDAGTYTVSLTISDGTNQDIEIKEDYINVEDSGVFTFHDDFESYTDFSLTFDPWTLVDVDGSETYGFSTVDFDNEYSPMAYIIFNPTATIPAMSDMAAHSGDKFAACFASTTPANDDWMITPQVTINNGDELSFWAKSYTDDYGLERFKVGVSTTGTAPSDFTIISAAPYEQAPVDNWTEFSYDLSSYAGQDVYIGIECVSYDAFVFMVDDIVISGASDVLNIEYNPNISMNGSQTKTEK
ncbi:MAG TPA: choice-of-anchor J domain-containing protein [Candidatus Cloacimonadota bacterium]|nr:choice-of-anchor J domain-containing protein [Candidatus Cloacimonadota bacterium]